MTSVEDGVKAVGIEPANRAVRAVSKRTGRVAQLIHFDDKNYFVRDFLIEVAAAPVQFAEKLDVDLNISSSYHHKIAEKLIDPQQTGAKDLWKDWKGEAAGELWRTIVGLGGQWMVAQLINTDRTGIDMWAESLLSSRENLSAQFKNLFLDRQQNQAKQWYLEVIDNNPNIAETLANFDQKRFQEFGRPNGLDTCLSMGLVMPFLISKGHQIVLSTPMRALGSAYDAYFGGILSKSTSPCKLSS